MSAVTSGGCEWVALRVKPFPSFHLQGPLWLGFPDGQGGLSQADPARSLGPVPLRALRKLQCGSPLWPFPHTVQGKQVQGTVTVREAPRCLLFLPAWQVPQTLRASAGQATCTECWQGECGKVRRPDWASSGHTDQREQDPCTTGSRRGTMGP